ncbi:Golgi to ER traffic protein 4 [Tyrophagus putrescentiae]|nr:Golgi to ER traffic protein 4 [Tyrophagus putrescentiae]
MSQRLNQKLAECLARGDFYEAHQIYRTIYFRLSRERKFAQAYRLLVEGATKLLSAGQSNSGSDLANLLVDMLSNADLGLELKSPADLQASEESVVNDLRQLFAAMVADSPERAHFVSKALSITFIPPATLRKHLALVLWREKNYAESRLHFIYSSDSGENCALMLVEYQRQQGFPSEVDLMIAQFVLQVLAAEKKQLAQVVFKVYTSRHPAIENVEPPFLKPLLNFIFFLLSAIDNHSGKTNVFNVLCSLYEKSLNRDPCYKEYLDQIGEIYFGRERKQKAPAGGIFSNLFQSLFNPDSDKQSPENGSGGGGGGSLDSPGPSTSSTSVANNQFIDELD